MKNQKVKSDKGAFNLSKYKKVSDPLAIIKQCSERMEAFQSLILACREIERIEMMIIDLGLEIMENDKKNRYPKLYSFPFRSKVLVSYRKNEPPSYRIHNITVETTEFLDKKGIFIYGGTFYLNLYFTVTEIGSNEKRKMDFLSGFPNYFCSCEEMSIKGEENSETGLWFKDAKDFEKIMKILDTLAAESTRLIKCQ